MRAASDERARVHGAQRGSVSDLETLFRTHWPRAHRAAYLVTHDAGAAEDIAQESFLAALRSLDTFDRRRPFGPWLHRIVVNAALMKLRAKRRNLEEAIDDLLPQFDEAGHHVREVQEWRESGDAAVERRETREILRGAIERLPENYRAVLMLRDIEEMVQAILSAAKGKA